MLDNQAIRHQFPVLNQTIYGKPLVYLDSAATTQKPQQVIDAIKQAYSCDYANVHRGVHSLSQRATEQFEATRDALKIFINAESREQIIFTKGATESLNLVADAYAGSVLKPGDEVLISTMEHHSNIVPWQQVCKRTGANLKIIPLNDKGDIDQEAYQQLLTTKVKIVSVMQVSNAMGTVNPVKEMIAKAKAKKVITVIDGTQAVQHMSVDVQALGCDFYAFSSHKMYGPSGVGILYGNKALLEAMPPYQSGGDMISMVTFAKSEFNVLPHKFEAGTPNIVGVIALRHAIEFMQELGLAAIAEHEQQLTDYALEKMQTIKGLNLITNPQKRVSVISFTLDGIHPHDIGTIMDQEGVAIRAGHHCNMPLMQHLKLPATARLSLAIYNNEQDIDAAIKAIKVTKKVFGDD